MGGVAGGVGMVGDDYADRLGMEPPSRGRFARKLPTRNLYAVKIFDRGCRRNSRCCCARWSGASSIAWTLINLSVGTRTSRIAARRCRAAADVAPPLLECGDRSRATACPRDEYLYRDGIFLCVAVPAADSRRPRRAQSARRKFRGRQYDRIRRARARPRNPAKLSVLC